MRIAILVGGLPPLYNGGTENATLKIADYATRAGHDVHILAADSSGRGKALYKSLENGFKVHRIPTVPPPYWHGLSFIPLGVLTISKLKPDIIHSQAIYMSLCALIASKLTGIPYLLYGRGGIYLDWFMKKRTLGLLMGQADRLVAQTENMKSAMLKYVKRDIEVIPNGIDAERFGRMSKREARSRLELPQDKKVVLSVGRCRPEKNLRNFVMAAKSGNGNATYVLVGDGTQLKELMELANGCVVFAGAVDNSEVPVYMSAADVLVNTSLSEGFPVAVLEGMASGLPIVAPCICGIPEIIEDGVNGILTMPRDYKSTAEAVAEILEDEGIAGRMADVNRQKAKEFTWEKVVEKLYG